MRHIFVLLSLAISYNLAISQDFEAKDIKIFPGEFNSHENFHIDHQSNYYIAGRGTGAIDFDFDEDTSTLPESSFRDLYLAKYGAGGELSWLLNFEGSETVNQIRALVSDEEGNIYVGGAFSGSLSLTDDGQNDINSTSTSMFVAKFNSNGVLQWQFTVGDNNFSQYPDKMFINEGRLIIQFVYDGTFDVDPGPETTMLNGDSNAMLVYDLDGSFLEAHSHRGGTVVRSSAMDSEGNIYLSGLFSGLVSIDYKTNASIITNGFFDAFIVKYDKDFNKLWHKRAGKSFTSLSYYELTLDVNEDIIIGALLEPEVTIGQYETMNDANYLIHMSKNGDYTNLTEILPEASFILDLATNSLNQLLLSATFDASIDIDPSEEVVELIPETGDNYFLAVYEADLSLTNNDQISSTGLNTYTVNVSDSDEIYILTDFEGEGKCILGNTNVFTAESEENFVMYKLDIDGCTTTSSDYEVEDCDEVVVNGETYTTSGSYQQILTNAEGCDSTINIIVQIYPSTATDTSVISCGPFEFNGALIDVSGTYNFVLTTMFGCDSVVTIALEVVELNTGITISGNEISALESEGDAYQWYDCDTEMIIEGANDSIFVPESDGNYGVQVFKGGCSFFTDCVQFTLVGIDDKAFDVSIAPNPTDGVIYINGDLEFLSLEIYIYDATGKEIFTQTSISHNITIKLGDFGPGIYFVRFKNGQKSVVEKVIVY